MICHRVRGCRAGAIVAAVLVGILHCGLAQAADLVGVYRAALEEDPTLAGQRAAFDAARERPPEALSGLLPVLSANGNVGRSGGEVTYTDFPTVDRTFNTLGWTLQLTLPVLRPEGIAAYREARAQSSQAQAQLNLAEQDLILRVTRAYFDVLTAQEGLSAADAELRATQEQAAVARQSLQAGVASVTDVDEAQSRAQLAMSAQLAASTDLQGKQAELEKIVGPVPPKLAALREGARIPIPEPNDAGQWVAEAVADNPGVLAQHWAVEAARLEVDKTRAQRLPVIDAVASVGRNYSSGNNTNPLDYGTNAHVRQGGFQFSVPLVDSGGIHAQIAEALARQRKAEADLEAARRQASTDARSAYWAVINGIAQVSALQASLDAGINSVRGNQAGYRVGLRINSDVLDAQRQRFAVERDLTKARYDALFAAFKLKAAAGTLQSTDVVAVNALLVGDID